MSVAEMSQGLSPEHWKRVTWREGTKGPMTSRFAATRVLPSHSYQHGGDKEQTLWLLTEWPEEEEVPTFGFLMLESLYFKKTSGQRWSLPMLRRELQRMLARWTGICPSCGTIIRRRMDSS